MIGRPRHDGDRYPSGKLRPAVDPGVRPRHGVDQTALTLAQAEAARRYVRCHELSQVAVAADRRVMALQAFMQARDALTPQEVAIIDMVVIRGRTVADVAIAAKRDPADMLKLYLTALSALADHYEAVG